MDDLRGLLDQRRAITRTLIATRAEARRCPCLKCQWAADVAWAALELWDVRLLALVSKTHKKALKALLLG
jgi:hypothetical protein